MTILSKIFPTLILSFLLSSGYAVAEGKIVPENIPGTVRITAEQLIDFLDEYDDLVIIDARKPADRVLGFIEDSIALPDVDTNATSLALHLEAKSTPVIFYCNGIKCGRSGTSAKIAVAEGYHKVYWFRGGWGEWLDKGYPTAK